MANWLPSGIPLYLRMRYLALFLPSLTHLHSLFTLQPAGGQLQPLAKDSLRRGSFLRRDHLLT